MNISAAHASSGSPPRKPAPGRVSTCLLLALPSPAPIERAIAAADRLRARIRQTTHLRTKRARPTGPASPARDLDQKVHELRDAAQQFGAAANRYKREPDRVEHLGAILETTARAFVRAERRVLEVELGAARRSA